MSIIAKTEQMAVAEDYYNVFSKDLLNDYLNGNPRTEAAIAHILKWLPIQTKNILDIGCGIGWTSFEIAKKHPNIQVFGVDLAPESLKIARKLFKRPNTRFENQDITADEFRTSQRFDAVLLVDVYEHIPAEARPFFHQSVAQVLNDNGRIMITCPTKPLQQWGKKHNPSGLQPIDEDITALELAQFAQDVEGELIYFTFKRIWNNNDYFHAVIEKKPQFSNVKRPLNEKIRDILPFRRIFRNWRVKSIFKQTPQ